MSKTPLFIAIFVILILGGVIVWIFIFPPEGWKPAPPPQNKEVSETPASLPSGRTTRISEEDTAKLPLITYSSDGFSPRTIRVKEGDSGVNCLVAVLNKDSAPLALGLGKYDPKITPSYASIPTGESMLLDPRFRVAEIIFHNHAKPHHEFSVILEGECQLD
ncbi:MAG: hypothetical protein HYW89_04690 [Candidatus Sungiibacteriota bacterium]|uniref:Uncharacterized protein n=1 Tax=Candidatus Sungiibacteriota bacterium TaxID=2750080 RepID=A0A7T5RJE3_9BACT|nr:MAG: hypothetical protein HYW89_04690 [Candidatus Sungbacteria bacterium]